MYASCAEQRRRKHVPSFRLSPVKSARSTTALGPWCVIAQWQVSAHAIVRADAGTVANRFDCWCSVRVCGCGPSHEKAFRRLGGCTRLVVLDNLREGVLSSNFYDGINRYRDVLAHYGVTALLCKVRDPDRKGKVESGVAHAQKTPLKGKKFESLEEAQAYLDHWEECWADKRIHGRTKRQVAAMFAEEKPFLQALPLEPFRYYQYSERTVHLDGCVEVEAAYYGAPPGWIGRKVNVQWDAMLVRLLDPRTGELLREHLSGKRGGHRIRDADRPRRTPPQLLQLLGRAHKAGPNIGAVCDAIHARQGELGMRRIQGVVHWPSNMAARPATALARRRWSCALPNIASCAAIWSAVRRPLSV